MATKDGIVVKSLFWSFLERIGSQGISLIISIILARLIAPDEYGIVAAATIFTGLATSFATGGFGNALIQKKDAEECDYSSLFWFNTTFSVVIYGIIFFFAPLLVRLFNSSYDYEFLILVIRVLGLGVLFSSFSSFYKSILIKRLLFKRIFLLTLVSTLFSASIGIYMAYSGFGVWALVVQNLLSYFLSSVLYMAASKWHPRWLFSSRRLKPMLSYGVKMMTASVLITVYADITNLVIGNKHSASSLAYYQKGTNFPKLLALNIITAINTSLFPIMSKMTDLNSIKILVRKFNRISAFVITPMMFGFAAVADVFVKVLLTEKWMQCVIFLQICCFSYAIQPLAMSSLQYLRASGRATTYLILDIIRKAIGILLISIAVILDWGVVAIAVAELISQFIAIFINMYPGKKYLGYRIREQVWDVLPKFLLSGVMYGIVLLVPALQLPDVLVLILQIAIGVGVYLLGAKLFKMAELNELLALAKKILKKA